MPTPSKRQILVVDDDPGVRDSVARSMPDVIVSDLNMPRMSRIVLLSEIRRRFPQIVTIAMSGAYRNSEELPAEVIADAFYSKGDHPTNLFGTLAQLLLNAPLRSA